MVLESLFRLLGFDNKNIFIPLTYILYEGIPNKLATTTQKERRKKENEKKTKKTR